MSAACRASRSPGCRNATRSLLLAVALLPSLPAFLTGQQAPVAVEIRRPRLPEGQDSNSAMAYYQLGSTLLAREPDRASDAFFWAARLDPGWAAPYYGLRAAMLLNLPSTDLRLFFSDRRRARRNPRVEISDSLGRVALLRNPFVDRRLDGVVLSTYIGRVTDGAADLYDLGRMSRDFAAWVAYARGDYQAALVIYSEEVRRHPKDPNLRMDQAISFFAQGQLDSARSAVAAALALERTEEADEDDMWWLSHAYAEYSIGFLHGLSGAHDSAAAAYERALLDDVTFHPAHRELARVRAATGDTAGALSEFAAAARLAPAEAATLYEFGMLLMVSHRPDSAVIVLQEAAKAEPFYAMPHYPLGLLFEHSGFLDEAVEHYNQFLRLAPRFMGPAITTVQRRLAALAPPASPP